MHSKFQPWQILLAALTGWVKPYFLLHLELYLGCHAPSLLWQPEAIEPFGSECP